MSTKPKREKTITVATRLRPAVRAALEARQKEAGSPTLAAYVKKLLTDHVEPQPESA